VVIFAIIALNMDAVKRFWKKVGRRRNPDECWLWRGEIRTGYGRFWYQGGNVTAHRFIYEQIVGRLPPRHEVDHVCRTRHCVNPKHLRALPHRENCIRRYTNLTHCPKGHRYTDANLIWYTRPGGVGLNRRCRQCQRAKGRSRHAAVRSRKQQHAAVTRPILSDRQKLKIMREARRAGRPNPFLSK
jgi:hypothetical protein